MADEEDDDVTSDGDKIDWKARYYKQRAATTKERERAETLDTQLKALKPKADAHDGLKDQLTALTKERDAEKSGRAFDRMVLAKGIDESDLEYVQYQYGKLPEKDRPSVEVWLKDLTSDAEKTPKWLANLLPKQQASSQSSSSSGQQGTQTQQQTQQSQSSQSTGTTGQQQGQRIDPNRTAVSTNGAHGAWQPTQEDRTRAHALALKGDYTLAQRIQQADGFAPLQLPGMGGGQQQGGTGGQTA